MCHNKLRITLVLSGLLCASGIFSQRILSLQQAIEQAMKSSPLIQSSRLSLTQSEENLKAQRAALKSNFSLNVNPLDYTHERLFSDQFSEWYTVESYSSLGNLNISQPILWTDGVLSLNNTLQYRDNSSTSGFASGGGLKGFSNSLDLTLEQPLFTYNRTKVELQELELSYENAAMSYALQELSVENSVTQSFYKVYQSQMALNISREEYENRKQSYEIIKNKVEGGLTAKEELYQAELDLMTSESTMKDNEVTFENDKDNFKQMLGIDLEEEIMVLADISVVPVDVELDAAIQHGLTNRMELRQREIAIENGQFDLIRTNALNEFKGDLTLKFGLFGENEDVHNVFEDPTNSQNISVGLTIPLWDWGEKKARLKAAQAALEMKHNDLRDEEIDIKLTIRQVFRSLENNLRQIEIARKNLENAQLTYEINLEKYKNGDLTSMDLNLVQNQLTSKKNQLTNSIISYKLELLNMKIQSMYDFENNVPVTPQFTKK
ncbi:TolC family protein [Saccharicrinis fermentans]|uniref:Type I secretion outer membrane protein n=1 Tax=Saccharicrinis fermentans DSM 9555 = JCM 21142 TaxID=869213 RepID=W7YID8_9BACT|nr:TolC family protein [Saccharicrinis fermentans]GAF02314.1 type I secretion outer membrane protein [Saccharicrinis fermentans DSM 9555 = JCM 21142]